MASFLKKKLRIKKPGTKDNCTNQPPTEDNCTKQPPTEDNCTKQPPTEDNCTNQPPTEDNCTKQPPTEDNCTKQPPTEDNCTNQPPTEDNCTNQPPPILDSNCTSHYEISVAIDFGTSNCAVAYSYASDKENVIVITDWQDGVPNQGKIPTAILFDKNQRFLAFGNTAIEKYRQFVVDEKQNECYFFQNFKMKLYDNKDLTENTMLHDQIQERMKALDVFTAAIKYMKEFLFDLLIRRGAKRKLADNEIAWVITVPAIWNNAAKQIMRRAAEKAGCLHWATQIALEPEAASIYCQKQPNVHFKELLKKNNTKYLVVDIGGGTLDITAHQILGPDHIKEIYRVSGSNLGGGNVDQLFIEYLITRFGPENIATIIADHLDDWLEIKQNLEKAKKKAISQSSKDKFSLKSSKTCPWDLDNFNKVCNIKTEGVELKRNGHLVFPIKLLAEMIAKVAHQIAQHVTKMVKEVDLNGLDAILLVGGFANSPIINEEMKNLVGENIRLIVPENAELCVVKGAVMFGWKRDIIRSRKSRYTYGFGVMKRFIEGEHTESRSYMDGYGKKKCTKIFDKLVTINDDLPIDKCVEHISIYPYTDKKYTTSNLYCTEDPDPKYHNVKGVELVGEIKIPNSKEKHGKRIIDKVYFGDTEIYVITTDKATGETYENTFDFLSDVRDVKFLE